MPEAVRNSAWLPRSSHYQIFGRSYWMDKLWSPWSALLILGALTLLLSPYLKDSPLIRSDPAAWVVHSYFVFNCILYIADVLIRVPWKDKSYCLVGPRETYIRLRYQSLVFLAMFGMGLYIYFARHQVVGHLLAMGAESAVLLYLIAFEPALGFVNWTWRDERRYQRNNKDRLAASRRAQAISSADAQDDATYRVPVSARKASLNFSGIYGMSAVKERLLTPAKAIIAPIRKEGEAPRNGILLHGEPGNGKTIFAEALAGELDVPFIELTYGAVSSQWLGNMPKVISNTFAYARDHAPCVLFVDEIDSFIPSRDKTYFNSEEPKITNTLLTEIVSLRSSGVILVGATNYLGTLDAAAIRDGRFDYKVEITPPDEEARIGLIQAGVKKYAIGLQVDPAQALSVAERWSGFSVARLLSICRALPDVAKKANTAQIGLNEWTLALREVQGARGKLPPNALKMTELVMEPQTKDALVLIASRLKDVARIEEMGGTLPTGVLFHGPSGTGKTAAARAVAKEVGWAFLSVAGPDLVADRSKLDKLFAEAKDLRPAVIFIDEADDILRSRQYSSTPDLVNKMLTLMDGVNERVRDVVWIAATNNPDQVDAALLRSGRFTEKVLFTPPPQDLVPRHVADWLKKKKVTLSAEISAFDVAEALQGQTIADIEGVLQYALNAAIEHTPSGQAPVVRREHLQKAMSVVLSHQEF
jgi:transitional endoplasmic reticulum ATPase